MYCFFIASSMLMCSGASVLWIAGSSVGSKLQLVRRQVYQELPVEFTKHLFFPLLSVPTPFTAAKNPAYIQSPKLVAPNAWWQKGLQRIQIKKYVVRLIRLRQRIQIKKYVIRLIRLRQRFCDMFCVLCMSVCVSRISYLASVLSIPITKNNIYYLHYIRVDTTMARNAHGLLYDNFASSPLYFSTSRLPVVQFV